MSTARRSVLLVALTLSSASCPSVQTSSTSTSASAAASSTSGAAMTAEPHAIPASTAAVSPPDSGVPDVSAAGSPTAPASATDPTSFAVLADGSNALGLEIYAAARRSHPNLALSPLSISTALTMVWAGARGETAAQMRSVLHLGDAPDTTLDAVTKVLAWARDPVRSVTLRIANRLFGEKTDVFEKAYLDRTKTAFGAALEPLDFAGAPDASRRQINDWVATQTDQRIKDLIPPRGVTHDTQLVLANAIYFLGAWEHPFKKAETTPAPFHLSTSSAKDVPTMHEVESLLFVRLDGVRVLQIPYAGGELAMTLVLPDTVDGLAAVESHLTAAMIARWVGALASARVRVALPSFEIDPPEALPLGSILAGLGMPIAFDRAKADFTGIATAPRPDARLFIGDVFHKAFVKVDEQGTEAAAATGVSVKRSLVMRREPSPEEFTADHPFLFMLRELHSGVILFMGRVGDPTERPPS